MKQRYVALFRGINVGKAKRVAMGDLRAVLASLGYVNVRTLLNSGNAVFDAPEQATAPLAARIRAELAKQLGVDAFVVVKSRSEIANIMKGNKLARVATDPSRLLVALAADASSLARLPALVQREWKGEVIHVGKHAAYLWCPEGMLESKAAVALLRDLAEIGTTRNWSTLEKIHDLLARD